MTINSLSGSPKNRRTTGAALVFVAIVASVVALQFGAGAASGRTASAPTVPATTTTTLLHWLTLETPRARGQALGRSVVAELARAGVPAPAVEVTDTGAAHGRFVQTTWTLQLSAVALSAVDQSSSEVEVLVETAHHEARHAEQWFRIAQLRSSQGATRDQLAAELLVPFPVAAAAAERPLATGSAEAIAAQMWHNSIYGEGAARRSAIVDDVLDKKLAYNAAASAHATNPDATTTAALQEAKSHFEEAYERYRGLPEEADAFATAEMRVNVAS